MTFGHYFTVDFISHLLSMSTTYNTKYFKSREFKIHSKLLTIKVDNGM